MKEFFNKPIFLASSVMDRELYLKECSAKYVKGRGNTKKAFFLMSKFQKVF